MIRVRIRFEDDQEEDEEDEQCINEDAERSSKHSPCSSMVEQWPPKPKVVGSNPVTDAFLQ